MVKPDHFFALLALASRGANWKEVKVSSFDLAEDLGVAQQTASRWLKELEKGGLVTRHVTPQGQKIRVTSKGKEALDRVHGALQQACGGEFPYRINFQGEVVAGLGDGKYYVMQEEYRRQFVDELGFDPYPGSLNLRLTNTEDLISRRRLDDVPYVLIHGFEKGGRTFGPCRCYRAIIGGKIEGGVILPERTHHRFDMVELLSPVRLRDELKLSDGDSVSVEILVKGIKGRREPLVKMGRQRSKRRRPY